MGTRLQLGLPGYPYPVSTFKQVNKKGQLSYTYPTHPLTQYFFHKVRFLRATAGTAIARVLAIAILSVRLSVRPSVCHTGGLGKNGAS